MLLCEIDLDSIVGNEPLAEGEHQNSRKTYNWHLKYIQDPAKKILAVLDSVFQR